MRVYVYAISKNEEKHAVRWMQSMSEADGVYVLDTGSQDGTVEALRALGAHVRQKKIEPWRFDTARNESLKDVPTDADICVCTDLDEVFAPGWRRALEKVWPQGKYVQARYAYAWSHAPDGSDALTFWTDKAHSRTGFRWGGIVHEVLQCEGERTLIDAEGVKLDHWPDAGKSRAQYLPLLEQAVREDGQNDRNVHYLGREYMYRGEYARAIDMLKRHLGMPNALWKDERCASMRYIARCYAACGARSECETWLLRAAAEAPWLREPWMDYARHCYDMGDWPALLFACERALSITEKPRSYITDPDAWGELPYDLLSIADFRLGRPREALKNARMAEEMAPESERIRRNRAILEKMAVEYK